MSEAHFVGVESLEKEKKSKETEKPLSSYRFIRQKSGMRAVKRRKRKERRALNRALHAPRKARKAMKKYGISDQIQRGFGIAKRWREE